MRATKSIVGWSLVVVSLLAVLQTARAIGLGEIGGRRYTERSVQDSSLTFAGRTIEIRDNVPHTETGSQRETDGELQIRIDGKPLDMMSHARVRVGLTDLGRYHGWLDAWVFITRRTNDSSLWVARRIQTAAKGGTHFELDIIHSNGDVKTRMVRGWQLGFDYRSFRSTQFVRSGEWEVLPLDVGDLAGLFPVALLLFPIGTFVAGIALVHRSRHRARAV